MHKPPEILLGVNIDHVATLRQSRNTLYPEPIQAALLAEQAGADAITIHLREDRRHIQERDVEMISKVVQTRINLEMAVTDEMVAIALKYKPADCCLVPERREELTTEGGLDVVSNLPRIKQVCTVLAKAGIRVSLFIDADPAQILAAVECGAPVIEIHTGHFADAETLVASNKELEKVIHAVQLARDNGLVVNAGHGLHYHNVRKIAAIQEVRELNIGHAIIAEALMTGLGAATKEMKRLMLEARQLGW
ncbi:Pyridoxine 5'-phosphate synthase [hydrothermal vent metagenome]|uniref:Pyridoxine 5'-phosphate synthase n=1 Tax=hydrothermal vent metagenome TaxID=652676 RepID=A0A3B0Z0H3_9ZZZZ